MMNPRIISLTVLLALTTSTASAKIHNVIDYGAKGDGVMKMPGVSRKPLTAPRQQVAAWFSCLRGSI